MIAPRPYVDHCSLCPRVSCAPRWSLHRHGTCWPHCACSCSLQSPFVVPRRADRGAEDATSHLACCSASALSHVSAASTPPLRRGLLPRVRGSPWAAHGALHALIANLSRRLRRAKAITTVRCATRRTSAAAGLQSRRQPSAARSIGGLPSAARGSPSSGGLGLASPGPPPSGGRTVARSHIH